MGDFGSRYSRGREYLQKLQSLRAALASGDRGAAAQFHQLRRQALLENPLLDFGQILLVRRRMNKPMDLAMPTNHECNTSLRRQGYENDICVLSPIRAGGRLKTVYRPADGGYVGEADLHWDADRFLFTRSDAESWKVWEIRLDGSGLRQVSQMPPDCDAFDACYLPDGGIVFGSTASFQAVPCWHGQRRVANLYRMNADGTGMRQLGFDQDHDLHPCVLPNGQVLYNRWDYTGINHIFLRQLMVMHPDGTGQRAIYGSNSWYPNALYFQRPLPGDGRKLVAILSGYHGVNRMGQLVVLDTGRGWREAAGIVRRISGRGDPIDPKVKDNLVDDDWPKFLHPYPISDKHFLVACWPGPKASWGIYLADVFDNLVLLHEERGYALLEPVPIRPSPKPPVLPDRVNPDQTDAVVYLHDVYSGEGLRGVPRGTVKRLRVLAYHFGYPGMAGPDVIGYGGPWEVMRILGTTPVEEDGSAVFRVPAHTPLAVQPLDAEGKAVQLMRSWFTAMPGEKVSCVGCHETPAEAGSSRLVLASRRTPRPLDPWYGPARGFDFAREVQPVLDKYCLACHQQGSGFGGQGSGFRVRGSESPAQAQRNPEPRTLNPLPPDLRAAADVADYRGRRISDLGVQRMHPLVYQNTQGVLRYAPAYDALLPYVRRVGIEDDVSLLVPGEYHADTSELVQLLRQGHYGVELDAEAWDRLVTWIDLNAPCHGTWGRAHPIPDGVHERRMELRRQCGQEGDDPEVLPAAASRPTAPPVPRPISKPPAPQLPGWPLDAAQARQRQAQAAGARQKTVNLGSGVRLELVLVPAGAFVIGSVEGPADEQPPAVVQIRQPFWMGACEVTNEQFRRFDPRHDCRYYGKRHARQDDQGLPLNGPKQPVVRVSWQEAMAFCRWLSAETGMEFSLPTEAQWEYACRAGSDGPLWFGKTDADFSRWANVADRSFSVGLLPQGKQTTGGLDHLVLEGADLADRRFSDGAVVTADVGSYGANPWGLRDVHGNAAEWTRSDYRPYPYRDDDGRNLAGPEGRKVVRGGSFFDRPARCRSALRLAYPAWQRVFNVGFRVAARANPER